MQVLCALPRWNCWPVSALSCREAQAQGCRRGEISELPATWQNRTSYDEQLDRERLWVHLAKE
jgi:hypothetical protein